MNTRHLSLLAALAATSLFSVAQAKDTTDPSNENRMTFCSTTAKEKGLKGEDRQEFMSKCLKGNGGPSAHENDEPSPKQLAQQNKMKSCNAEAGKKDLHGDERRAFMSKCLKG